MSLALILSGVLGAILTALAWIDLRKWLADERIRRRNRRRRGYIA